MNPLIRKEIRQLLPSWSIALLFALSIWLLPKHGHVVSPLNAALVFLQFAACPAIILMMALDSFGTEFGAGTFSILLAQPISRSRLWWMKSMTLASAIASVTIVWWTSYILNRPMDFDPSGKELRQMLMSTGLFALAAYCGGLWTVLLLRQVAAAFWFTILVPAALIIGVINPLQNKYPDQIDGIVITVFCAYGLAGFIFARWLFLRAQDTQWTGGTIELPRSRGLFRFGNVAVIRGRRHSIVALIGKEIQLHQSQFIIAGVLLLLHLGAIVTRKLGGGLKDYPALEFVLSQFWMLWLVLPFLAGCAAVAEERKLGTLEGQLCLPTRRSAQFLVKFAVVICLSLLFGLGMPLLLEGHKILPSLGLIPNMDNLGGKPFAGLPLWKSNALVLIAHSLPTLIMSAISVITGALAFYASTFTRSTLQALAPAIVAISATLLLRSMAFTPEDFIRYPLWRGWLIYIVAVPVLIVVLIGLMYWNFKRVLVGFQVWRRNLLTILTALGLTVSITTAVYHRVWELFTVTEPKHGGARLAAVSPKLAFSSQAVILKLPDGSVWMDRFVFFPEFKHAFFPHFILKEMPGGGRFLQGSNWTSVAINFCDIAAIQKDGTLWVSEKPFARLSPAATNHATSYPSQLVRLGEDNDWKSVEGHGLEMFLLKTNGTLWRLGMDHFDSGKDKWPGLRNLQPKRLGNDSDWAEISSLDYRTCFRKKDGRAWEYPQGNTTDRNPLQLAEGISIHRSPLWDHHQWRNLAWCYVGRLGIFRVGVRDDGTFRVAEAWQSSANKVPRNYELVENIQFGHETNWIGAVVVGDVVITLKSDGSLWKWHFPDEPLMSPESAYPVPFSSNRDWVGILSLGDGMLSFAADGSFWRWEFVPKRSYSIRSSGEQFELPPLLAASRRPRLIGDIFKAQ